MKYLPALAAFLIVVIFIMRQHCGANKLPPMQKQISCPFPAGLQRPSKASPTTTPSPIRSHTLCLRAVAPETNFFSQPAYKKDPDIWVDDELVGVHQREIDFDD